MTQSMRDKINLGFYNHKLPYPNTNYRDLKTAYWAEEKALNDLFKVDALEETKLTKHPKAEKAYQIAWDRGHASGYYEVFMYLEELAELLLED